MQSHGTGAIGARLMRGHLEVVWHWLRQCAIGCVAQGLIVCDRLCGTGSACEVATGYSRVVVNRRGWVETWGRSRMRTRGCTEPGLVPRGS